MTSTKKKIKLNLLLLCFVLSANCRKTKFINNNSEIADRKRPIQNVEDVIVQEKSFVDFKDLQIKRNS